MNGKKWNGKGYNINGNIEYEIKDGNGYIKEYDKNGKLIFEGEYINGIKWNGKINEYDVGKLIFEGDYISGEKKGTEKEYNYERELIYEGE